jgi:S-adenosylmethionine hydrolase
VAGGVHAVAVLVDHFGNVSLECGRETLQAAGLDGDVEVGSGGRLHPARVASTFADVDPGSLVVLIDSHGQVAVCVRNGSAADVLEVGGGDPVSIRRRA